MELGLCKLNSQKIRQTISENIPDIAVLSSILLIFTILMCIVFRHQGNVLVDCFTQGAYIPEQVLKGKVLYKDILVPYGPFSYQLNALLFGIFGISLNTLYIAGILNTTVILITFYFIARCVTSRLIAFTVSCMVMATCTFDSHIFNYIFPYAYAMSYSFSAFLLSVLFCSIYLKRTNPRFIPLAFFFIGLSILSKIDFILFLIILTIVLFFKPVPLKYLIVSIIAFLTVPLISWTLLFLQGLTINDLLLHTKLIHNLIKSPIIIDLYKDFGFYLTKKTLILNFIFFKNSLLFFILSSTVIYPVLTVIYNKYSNIIKLKFSKIFQISLLIGLITILAGIILNTYYLPKTSFCWIAIISPLIPVCIIGHKIYNKEQLIIKDKLTIFLIFAGIFASARSFFFINLGCFGSFLAPLLFLSLIIFITDYLPNYFKFIDKEIWKKNCFVVFASITLVFAIENIYTLKTIYTSPISTQRGLIYFPKLYADPYNQAISYINTKISKNDSIIMIPKGGPSINFLTNHPANDLCYELQPFTIEVLGESRIIQELKRNPPDLILINNSWKPLYFGKDFGINIYEFIRQNYSFERKFGDDFMIQIYKKKTVGKSVVKNSQ